MNNPHFFAQLFHHKMDLEVRGGNWIHTNRQMSIVKSEMDNLIYTLISPSLEPQQRRFATSKLSPRQKQRSYGGAYYYIQQDLGI
jgi:hypothetical protein